MAEVWSRALTGSQPLSKNVHVQVQGWIDQSPSGDLSSVRIVDVSDFLTDELRLDGIVYAISEKVEVLLAWEKENGGHHVALPLAGRGTLNFDSFNGIQNTVGEGKVGHMLLSAQFLDKRPGLGFFTLMLDFSKQRKGN